MIHHVFNSSLVSGPETLVLPNLQNFSQDCEIVLLQETRLPAGSTRVAQYAEGLGHAVTEISVHSRFDFRAARELTKHWDTKPPEIVHAHGPKASLHALMARSMLPIAKRPAMITTHHGVRANDQSMKLRLFEMIYEKAVIPYYDLCLTVCTSDRELLIRRGIKAEKIQVHVNGVDRKLTIAADRPALNQTVKKRWQNDFAAMGPGGFDGFLVGVVGRLSIEKQHHRILEALAFLAKREPGLNPKLICFGSGLLETQLKQQSAKLQIENRVHWLGYRDNIAEEMAGLDVLLSLSNAEGLPINLIEAGWSGTPVVAQGVDGVRDLIEDGKSGILLDAPATSEEVANALTFMATKKSEAEEMGYALQERVNDGFSRTAWVKRLEEIYREFNINK